MIIESTTNNKLIKSIITEPKLWQLEYGQGMDLKDYQVDNYFKYLLIKENDEVIGLFQTRELTRIVLEAHIYILPAYWGKDYSINSIKTLINYLQDNTTYINLLTDVPKVCKHVIRLMKRIKATQCGYIKNGVIYNNQLTDLLLFNKDLRA